MSFLERLNAAIDQAEQQARAATPGPWLVHAEPATSDIGETYWIYSASHGVTVTFEGAECSHIEIQRDGRSRHGRADAEHVAANDPANRLRNIAEDRGRLAEHAPILEFGELWCGGCGFDNQEERRERWPCPEALSVGRRYGIGPEDGEHG